MRPSVGIDVGQRSFVVCVMDAKGLVLQSTRLGVDPAGRVDLLRLLRQYSQQRPGLLHIAVEDPRGVVISTLTTHGFAVHQVRPFAATHARGRVTPGGSKDDFLDAELLANLMRTEPHGHRRVPANSCLIQSLFVLARAQSEHGQIVRTLDNQMHAHLVGYYPAYVRAFPRRDTKRARATLRAAPTPAAARRLTANRLREVLAEQGVLSSRGASFDLVQPLREEEMRLPRDLERTMGVRTLALLESLEQQERIRDGLTEQLLNVYAQHSYYDAFASFPGLGGLLGARILAEVGDDPERFSSAHGWQALAGVRPVTKASGAMSYDHRRFIHNKHLGHAVHIWTLPLMKASPAARSYYDRCRSRGDRYGTAARKLGCAYLGILWQCVRQETAYDEARALARFAPPDATKPVIPTQRAPEVAGVPAETSA